ncbi:MAG: GDP-L-fucose synthase [Bacteroidales bacterium]|nr:GDP-L-fucose synthase [Bacteroidales bacterium]
MELNAKIYIAGHNGMVGSAIHRNLIAKGYSNFVLRSFSELDLTRQADVEAFFEQEKPDYVFVAAAKVGGIVANNTYRAQFIYENLMIQNNIIHAAYLHKVKKLLFLGSSCIYPKNAPQPLKEEYLLTGLLEETNEPYAIAKIAGIKMCENYYRQYGCDFISVMPTNLYGPNDNYDLEKSHVLPALIRKMHLGKCLEQNDWDAIRTDLNKRPIEGVTGEHDRSEIQQVLEKYGVRLDQPIANSQKPIASVALWGTGQVYREFLHVNDMAGACVHIMQTVSSKQLYTELHQTHLNIGTGIDLTIRELAETVKQVVGFEGRLDWDDSKPNGTYKKQLDIKILEKLGWRYKLKISSGIKSLYIYYISQEDYLNENINNPLDQ